MLVTALSINAADQYNERLSNDFNSSTQSLAMQVKILQDKFDLENRPWVHVTKVTYQFTSDLQSKNVVIYPNGQLDCNSQCVDQLRTMSNSNLVLDKIDFYYENTGNAPAVVKKGSTQKIFGIEFELMQDEYLFPNNGMPIFADVKQRVNLVQSSIPINVEITYSSLENSYLNKLYKTTYTSELFIRPDGPTYSLFFHQNSTIIN